MTINTATEELIEFRKAMAHFPGRKPCIQTGYRWASRGVELKDGSRVILETLNVGGTKYTSAAAIQRFIEAQNAPSESSPAPVSPKQRERQSTVARRELAAMGIGN